MEARRAHNPEVVGSSPASATKENTTQTGGVFLWLWMRTRRGRPCRRQGKKVSGGHFFSPGKSPWMAGGIRYGCGLPSIFCAPGYEYDERSSPRKRPNRRRKYRAPQTGTSYRSPEKLPVGRKSSPASATRLSRHSESAMTTFYLVFVELLV